MIDTKHLTPSGIDFLNSVINGLGESRQSTLEDTYADSIEELKSQYFNTIGYTETMDRSFMQHEVLSQYLSEHPCILFDDTSYELSLIAETALFLLYQRQGNLASEYEVP